MWPEAFFFDFDGVIVDTETIWVDCMLQFCMRHALNIARDDLLAYLGDGDVMMLKYIGKCSGFAPEEILDQVRPDFVGRTECLSMRPGVQRYLEYAHSQGIALALVSNSRRPYIDRWLKRLRLTDWFDGVVTRDGTLAIKPAPDLYLKAVREMGTTPGNVIAIEDSAMGLKAALAAGLCAVAFPNQASEKLVKEFFPLCVALEQVAPQEFIRRVAAYYR